MSSLQSPSDASARNDLVYGLDDRPSAPIALLAALQHLLAIIVPIVTPAC
ncbi:putative transporter [Pseudomonas aeruginosa]|nr:putative transporter [Pseudomonas aeruginosa]